jgi:hypothetical protein
MPDQRLINAYKRARDLIAETPEDKEYIINEYIDLVEKINNYYNGGAIVNDDGSGSLANMLKNPLEIEIYNNFQRYGAGSTIPMSAAAIPSQDGPSRPSLTYEQGANILLNVSEYAGAGLN